MSQKDIDELADADRPYLQRYPDLVAWLDSHDARCLSQEAVGESYFEKWVVNARVIILEIRPRSGGWELWTAFDSTDVKRTLEDAERRVGITKEQP